LVAFRVSFRSSILLTESSAGVKPALSVTPLIARRGPLHGKFHLRSLGRVSSEIREAFIVGRKQMGAEHYRAEWEETMEAHTEEIVMEEMKRRRGGGVGTPRQR